MKRIFLLLAAVAAFASCVKENDIVPDQPETQADNIVTLKATSSDTKAVLDGADVLWYGEETVEVVLQESGNPVYNIELTANVAEASKNATFTGTISETAKNDTELDETGWAVYPNTAVPDFWDGFLQYTLPETQNGTDIAHISSALVNTSDIQAGVANASFNNFLTLLKITVPEGVNEVSLTADYGIVGKAILNTPDAEEGKLTVKSYSTNKTVTLSTGSELDPGTVYSVSVFPGTATTLTLTMTGEDSNDVYESTLQNVILKPGTYRTIDLTEVFAMGVQAGAEIEISPVGGEHVISVADAAGYTYTVEESADWLEAEVLETRSFSGKDIVLTATANLTSLSRSADVTVSWSDQSRTFTVSQESISSDYLEFVYVDPTDPANSELIQWSESFKIYANPDDATAGDNIKKERSGQFTIDFTEGEECAYGMYKITGLFFTDNYYSGISGQQINKGGVYYADYDSVNNKLTVHMSNAEKSYFFTSDDVVLEYDSVNKSFSISDPVSFDMNYQSEYNKAGVIYNYKAKEYVAPDPGEGGVDASVAKYIGEYVEGSFTSSYNMLTPGILKIEASDDLSKGTLKIVSIFGKTPSNMYASVSSGEIITDANATINDINGSTPIGSLTLNVNPETMNITMSDITLGGWMSISDYAAYSIVGSYDEGSFTSSYNMLTPGILKIEASDDLSKGTLKIVSIFGKTPSNMYANVSSGKIITDANATINDINGSTPIGSLTLSYAINEGKLNITMVDTTIGGWMTVSSYTAVK